MENSTQCTTAFTAAALSRLLRINQTFHGTRVRIRLDDETRGKLDYIKEHSQRQLPHVVIYLIDYAIDHKLPLYPNRLIKTSKHDGLNFTAPALWVQRISDVAWELDFVQNNGQLKIRHFMGACVETSLREGPVDKWLHFFYTGFDIIDRITMSLSQYVRQ